MPDPSLPDPFEQPPELRGDARYRVRWSAVATIDDDRLTALVKDISPQGATLLLERNLHAKRQLTLDISLPPMHKGGAVHHMRLQGKLVYTIHDDTERMFRAGLQIESYAAPADRSMLEKRLVQYHTKVTSGA